MTRNKDCYMKFLHQGSQAMNKGHYYNCIHKNHKKDYKCLNKDHFDLSNTGCLHCTHYIHHIHNWVDMMCHNHNCHLSKSLCCHIQNHKNSHYDVPTKKYQVS